MAPLVEKTQSRLEEIAAGVHGVFGLVVEDLAGDYRFAVNEDRQFAQASAIKIPILMTVLREAHEGKLDLAEMRWIDKKTGGTGILAELGSRTTQMSVEDLAVLMIVLSDNTATNMLIDEVGLKPVTDLMFSLGAEDTRLQRRMMDTVAAARGEENLSTPADAARIMRLLQEGKFVDRKVSDHALAILRKAKPGAVKSAVPPDVPVAFKPGAIPGVATEWAIVELPDQPYIVIVMGAYGEDAALKQAMKNVSAAAYDFFHRVAHSSKYGAVIEKK